MSEGTPWKRLAMFAIPLVLGNFAQQLYNTVDTIVVGNSKWGYNALAAVGSAFPILNLMLALFVGIATGAGIMVAQFFGARNKEGLANHHKHFFEFCIFHISPQKEMRTNHLDLYAFFRRTNTKKIYI